MKRLQDFVILAFIAAFGFLFSFAAQAQDLGEIDGTLRMKMNSTSGTPHIRLIEDDLSSGGSTRLTLEHEDNSDRFELRGFLSAGNSNKRLSWYFNSLARMTYSETFDGLGIGTVEPDGKLHVQVSGFDGIKIEGDGTGDARLWINNTAGNHYFFDDDSDANALGISSANDLKINTGGAERMRCLETGQFGINVAPSTSRQVKIETDDKLYGLEVLNDEDVTAAGVLGEVQSIGVSNKFGVIGRATGSAGTGNVFGIWGSASTTPVNSYAVYCSGDLYYTGALAGPSDIKLKENIVELQPVLDKVLQLKAKTYTYKNTEFPKLNLASGIQKGFVAQDLQKLFPDIVELGIHATGVEDNETVEILSVKYLELIPILTKAIQEQHAIIDEMRREIDALKAAK